MRGKKPEIATREVRDDSGFFVRPTVNHEASGRVFTSRSMVDGQKLLAPVVAGHARRLLSILCRPSLFGSSRRRVAAIDFTQMNRNRSRDRIPFVSDLQNIL